MGLGSALARGISGVASGVSRASQSWPEERARQANLLQRQHELDLGEESRIAKEAEAAAAAAAEAAAAESAPAEAEAKSE